MRPFFWVLGIDRAFNISVHEFIPPTSPNLWTGCEMDQMSIAMDVMTYVVQQKCCVALLHSWLWTLERFGWTYGSWTWFKRFFIAPCGKGIRLSCLSRPQLLQMLTEDNYDQRSQIYICSNFFRFVQNGLATFAHPFYY